MSAEQLVQRMLGAEVVSIFMTSEPVPSQTRRG